jgi:hypothetical protein
LLAAALVETRQIHLVLVGQVVHILALMAVEMAVPVQVRRAITV